MGFPWYCPKNENQHLIHEMVSLCELIIQKNKNKKLGRRTFEASTTNETYIKTYKHQYIAERCKGNTLEYISNKNVGHIAICTSYVKIYAKNGILIGPLNLLTLALVFSPLGVFS